MAIKQSLDKPFNYTATGGSQQLRLPQRVIERIVLNVNYTVTDAGIAAGETFDGVVDELLLGDDQNVVLQARRDEMAVLGDILHQGISTGIYSDPLPTTATPQPAHFTFTGPFDLRSIADPILRLNLRPATDEWSSATNLVASVSVDLYYADDEAAAAASAIVVRRGASASSTEHRILAPSDVDTVGLFIVTGTGNVLTKYQVGSDLVQPNAYSAHADYSQYKKTAPQSSPSRYMSAPVASPAASNKEFLASASSATTLTVWFVGAGN